MSTITVKMVCAGIMFGLWPLFINRSCLNGNNAALAMTAIMLLIVLPCMNISGLTSSKILWIWVVAAGVSGAMGMLVFNSGISQLTPQTIGPFFVIMIVTQISIPAIYHIIQNGSISRHEAAGLIMAIAAAILLNPKK